LVAFILLGMAAIFVFTCIVGIISKAAFYVNALAWLDNKRASFVGSFKLGTHFRVLIFWAVIVGLVLFLHDLFLSRFTFSTKFTVGTNDISAGTYLFLPLFGMKITAIKIVYGWPRLFWIIDWLYKLLYLLFFIVTIYVVITLATSYVSVGAAIKRSFSFVRHTWLSLLGVLSELVGYLLLMIAIKGIVSLVLGAPWALRTLEKASVGDYLFFKSFVCAPLWYASIVVLYKRQFISAQ